MASAKPLHCSLFGGFYVVDAETFMESQKGMNIGEPLPNEKHQRKRVLVL